MRRLIHPVGLLLVTSGLWGCATSPPAVETASFGAARLVAIAFNQDGSRLLAAKQLDMTCVLVELDPASGAEMTSRPLHVCPSSIEPLPDGSLLIHGDRGAFWADDPGYLIVAAASRADFIRREGSKLVWVRGAETFELPSLRLRDIRVLDREDLILAVTKEQNGETLIGITPDGEVTRLVPEPLMEIDSYDVAPDHKEFVLSARRSGGFDVSLGSTGSPVVRWVASDPLDEVLVSWAPRGSKVTYVVHGRDGSLLRSLHVPTGYSLTVDLPHTDVSALAWEPRAERFAIVASTPGSSSHVQLLAYGGEDRRVLLGPERVAERELEPILWPDGSAWLSRPPRISYGASYPVLIWTGVDSPFQWSDARADALAEIDALAVLSEGGTESLTKSFWDALGELAHADLSRVVVIAGTGQGKPAAAPPGVRLINGTDLERLAAFIGKDTTR